MSTSRLRPSHSEHGYLQLIGLRDALAEEAARLRGATIVDLGCGAKPYAPLFSQRYLGVDISAFHGTPDVLAAAERVPLRSGSVDAVLTTQHLEHAEDPEAVIDEAHRVLRPDGTLLLSTHGVWVHHPDPHDYWRWTEEGLRRLIESRGFTVDRVHHQGEIVAAAALLLLAPLGKLRADPRRSRRLPAAALIAAGNAVAGCLDAAVTRRAPRHWASPSYLVSARRTGSPV